MTEQNGGHGICSYVLPALLVVVVLGIFFGAIALLGKSDKEDISQPPKYSISITGVAGLDADDVAGTDRHRPTLSPVFNLTLGISNTGDKCLKACVSLPSTASVSYGDAFLGKGSVAPFCAEAGGESEGRARAWGQDVAVPRFLRDQLAGEMRRGDAAVDVEVRMPWGCNTVSCYDTVLVCKARIRGGPPCLMTVAVVPIPTRT